MDAEEFKAITEEVIGLAQAGDLDRCERLLLGQLSAVRGVNPLQELSALSNLASIYGRVGRVFESLLISRHAVDQARGMGDAYREARALSGVCIGRHGLRLGADMTDDVLRLRELMEEFPLSDETFVLNMEAAFVEYTHALDRGDLDEAHRRIDAFRAIADTSSREHDLAVCVHLAAQAVVALRRDTPARTIELLDEIERRGVAHPFHQPELTVLRVEAHLALDDVEAARVAAGQALEAIETAPPSALSDTIHFGGRLADALAGPLGDVDAARRAYDIAATSVFARIKQIDMCMDALPELGIESGPYQRDLVRYRKVFVSRQKAVLARVAEMFRGHDGDDLRRLIEHEDAQGFVAICAWCESVRGEDGRWIGIGHLVPREGPFQITHGICPPCSEAMA